MSRPRIVLVSSVVPYADIPHAGGRYLATLVEFLESETDLTVVTTERVSNREAATRPGAPHTIEYLGLRPGRSLPERIANFLVVQADQVRRRFDPAAMSLPELVGLGRPSSARQAIRDADVIDLQWFDSIRLAPRLRKLNPNARIVGTFHDVQSQAFARETPTPRRGPVYWRLVSRVTARREQRLLEMLDEAIVFSDKDAELLGASPKVRVVRPPLATGAEAVRPTPPGPPTLIMVGFLQRDENNRAALWLLSEIWPRIRRRRPDAVLRLVGDGASDELRARAAEDPTVVVTGFVPEIAAEYGRAWAGIVPLRHGAGVKFKTIESLLHGVPTVVTPTGAEGIGAADLFAECSDDPARLADAVCAIFDDPVSANARAVDSFEWARSRYGIDEFRRQIRRTWENR